MRQIKALLLACTALALCTASAAAQSANVTKAPSGCVTGSQLCSGFGATVSFGGVGSSSSLTGSGVSVTSNSIGGAGLDYTVWNPGNSVITIPWMIDFHVGGYADGSAGSTTWMITEEVQLGGSLAGLFTSGTTSAPSQGPVITGLGTSIPFAAFVSAQRGAINGGVLQGWGGGGGIKWPIGINWTAGVEYTKITWQNPGPFDPTSTQSAMVNLTYHFH